MILVVSKRALASSVRIGRRTPKVVVLKIQDWRQGMASSRVTARGRTQYSSRKLLHPRRMMYSVLLEEEAVTTEVSAGVRSGSCSSTLPSGKALVFTDTSLKNLRLIAIASRFGVYILCMFSFPYVLFYLIREYLLPLTTLTATRLALQRRGRDESAGPPLHGGW